MHSNITSKRQSKSAQQECQQLFLGLYFRGRFEVYEGVIYALRNNGFLVYVPAFDHKGPVYLQTKEQVVCMDPTVLGLPECYGTSLENALSGSHSESDEAANPNLNEKEIENYKISASVSKKYRLLPDFECKLSSASSPLDTKDVRINAAAAPDTSTSTSSTPFLTILPRNVNESAIKSVFDSLSDAHSLTLRVMDRVYVEVTSQVLKILKCNVKSMQSPYKDHTKTIQRPY